MTDKQPITPGNYRLHRDTIAEKLDEMADLADVWRRNREKGRNPSAIRAAMLMLAREVADIARAQDEETAAMMDRLCGPTAYAEIHSAVNHNTGPDK